MRCVELLLNLKPSRCCLHKHTYIILMKNEANYNTIILKRIKQ
jgi:hypothetical protein